MLLLSFALMNYQPDYEVESVEPEHLSWELGGPDNEVDTEVIPDPLAAQSPGESRTPPWDCSP